MPAKTNSTKNKVVSSSAKKSNGFSQKLKAIPLFGKLLIAVVLLAGVTYTGYAIYNKHEVTKYKALAGTYQLKASDYPDNKFPANGVRFALCKRNEGKPGGPPKMVYIGIASRPQLLNFYSSQKVVSLSTGCKNPGSNYPSTGTRVTTNAWFSTYPDSISFTWLRPANGDYGVNTYFSMSYDSSWTSKDSSSGKTTMSNWVPMWLVPNC